MRWWKKNFFIEGNMTSNSKFITMYFFIIFNSIIMQRNKWYKCNIFITTNNQWIIFILWHYGTKVSPKPWYVLFNKCLGINPMGLSATLDNHNNRQLIRIYKLSPKPWYSPPKNCKVLTQLVICDPWSDSYLLTWINLPNLDNKPLIILLLNLDISHKKNQGLDTMFLCAPWADSCLHNWINPPNLNHQTLVVLLSKPWYFWPKHCKGLTQWAFVTLGPTLIYATETILQTLTTKPWCPFFQKTVCAH